MSQTRKTRSPMLKNLMKWGSAVAAILFVGVLLVALAGVFHPKTPSAGPPRATQPVSDAAESFERVEVKRVSRPTFESAVGTIKPVHEVSLAAKILAKVIEVNVRAGQQVKVGELLVQLDDADLKARLRQSETAQQSAEANQARAASDLARAEQLLRENAISRAEYDGATASARSARAEFERLGQSIEEAKILLSYARIVSPIDGTIVDRRVEAGDTVTPGQVLMTLYDPEQMQLVATVRESMAQRLRVGQTVPARIESLGYDCEATISEIVPEASAASRSFLVKVTGPCPPGIYSGMFGRILIPLDPEDVLVIPQEAVRQVGQLSIVEVWQGERWSRRSVRLGRRMGQELEVLAGLREGETIAMRAERKEKDLP